MYLFESRNVRTMTDEKRTTTDERDNNRLVGTKIMVDGQTDEIKLKLCEVILRQGSRIRG